MPQALREAFMAEVKSLQKKPIMKITTSVEGAYGESSVFSLLKLFYLLNSKFGLTEHSTFLDIGSGSGVPSFTAAAFGCPYSLGFELDSTVYSISIINQLSLVDLLLLQQLCLSTHVNQEGLEANIEEALLRVFDCSRLLSLEGISHVFSFDLAMPPWIIGHIVQLFNQ
ncbi:hypothetical protein cyc_03935 [Cyclospora cayetanensis]|uniref:DOT1 domain-containing protein n=1 Tax=Cyclospora cayetanensis TaxID=88456 RepID=A0A1D3D2K8_9EIME|nr:hypothetical protein cyc_03935 [Cyclospora cayetanensis]